jgi:hypothetical protein
VLGTLVGVVFGLALVVLSKVLGCSVAVTGQFSSWFLMLPLALLVSSAMTKCLVSADEGYGTVTDVVSRRWENRN